MTHKNVSFVKSALRIVAGLLLIVSGISEVQVAGGILITAEALGILEEVVEEKKV